MDDHCDDVDEYDSDEVEEKERMQRRRRISEYTEETANRCGTTANKNNNRTLVMVSEQACAEDSSPATTRDEEDEHEDEEDTEEREDTKYDPERLKAFNMFVRLFVDENLDRAVPISKQPKDKIQAIIDSCSRQFPEFFDRARKRLRTYLKSCRRYKRSRDPTSMDAAGGLRGGRSVPPHLTSVHAEQVLAQACENEGQNAKRMRIGLEPISQPMPQLAHHQQHQQQQQQQQQQQPQLDEVGVASTRGGVASTRGGVSSTRVGVSSCQTATPISHHNDDPLKPHVLLSSQQQHEQQMNVVFPRQQNATQQHPVDIKALSSSSLVGSCQMSAVCHLSQSELAAVRQLISGYRESANFLRRSADELELLVARSSSASQ